MQNFNYSFAAMLVMSLGAVGATGAFGCTAVTNTTAIQCKADSECSALGPDFYGYSCNLSSHTCEKVAEDADLCVATADKSANQSCIDKFNGDPAICSPKSHRCVRLKTPECPDLVQAGAVTDTGTSAIANDDTVVVGLYDSFNCCFGLGNVLHDWAKQALSEVMQANPNGIPQAGGKKRPLVLLTCPEVQTGRLAAVGRATKHLVEEVEVPLVIGPILYDDINVTYNQGLRDAHIPSILPTVYARTTVQTLPNPVAPAPLIYDINPEEKDWVNFYSKLISEKLVPEIQKTVNEPIRVAMISERALLLKSSEPLFESMVQVNGKPLSAQATDAEGKNGTYFKVSIADTTDTTINPNPQAEINAAIAKIVAWQPHIVIHNTNPTLPPIEMLPMLLGLANPAITFKPYHIDYNAAAFAVPALGQVLAQIAYPPAHIFGAMAHHSPEDEAARRAQADVIKNTYGVTGGDPVALGPVVYSPPHQTLYDPVWLAAYMISALGNKPLTAENFASTIPLLNSADAAAPKIQAGSANAAQGFAATSAGTPIKFRGISSSMNFENNGGTVKYTQIEGLCADEKAFPIPAGFWTDPAGANGVGGDPATPNCK